MAVAFLSAQRSKDPSSQIGACIVNQDKKIVGIGYNGGSKELLVFFKTLIRRCPCLYLFEENGAHAPLLCVFMVRQLSIKRSILVSVRCSLLVRRSVRTSVL